MAIGKRAEGHLEGHLVDLDARLTDLAQIDPYREPVGEWRCFRGIDTLTAILILAELHDFQRFNSAPALMAFLGLVPPRLELWETSARPHHARTGNVLVRRLLVEVAWHYQHQPGIGKALARRRTRQPARVIAMRIRHNSRCVDAAANWQPNTSRHRTSRSRWRASLPVFVCTAPAFLTTITFIPAARLINRAAARR